MHNRRRRSSRRAAEKRRKQEEASRASDLANARRRKPLVRLLLLPFDLTRTVFMAICMSLWHLQVTLRTAIFRIPAVRAFCHPVHTKTESGASVSLCPFTRRYGSPELFAMLCNYCHRSERSQGRCIYICKRKGSGPTSSVTQMCFGVIPVLVLVTAFLLQLGPGEDLLDGASHLVTDALSESNGMPRKKPLPQDEQLVAAPDSEDDGEDVRPYIPPMPTIETVTDVPVPPPPLGFTPRERRIMSVAPQRETSGTAAFRELLTAAQKASRGGQHRDAIKLCERLIGQNPIHLESLLLLAKARLATAQRAAAKATAERILAVHPRAAEAHAVLGEIHLAEGQTAEAELEYEKALKLDPDCTLARTGLARIELLGNPAN